jgi:hypothetical protein
METAVDHAKRAISDLAVVLAVINSDNGRIEFEALDDCEIDTVFARIGAALVFVPYEPLAGRQGTTWM